MKSDELSQKDIARFFAKVEKTDGCWLWKAGKFHFGHGAFKVSGKMFKAHRVSYVIANGSLDDDLCVLHKCDIPGCVNPSHLFVGTKGDNAKDRDAKGRTTSGEKSHLSKLTREQVEEIRSTSVSSLKLASIYGVCSSNIRTIRRAETWK